MTRAEIEAIIAQCETSTEPLAFGRETVLQLAKLAMLGACLEGTTQADLEHAADACDRRANRSGVDDEEADALVHITWVLEVLSEQLRKQGR